MTLKVASLFVLISFSISTNAQLRETFEHTGEYGGSVGLGQYFGDLNPNGDVSHAKFAGGIFYLKQLNNYISLRANANYIFIGYSDAYSSNPVQKLRNLSFDSDVWEVTASGVFNFFKFYPELEQFRFTPFISLGVGAIHFDPYAFLGGKKYFLRTLGTEGQGNPLVQPYKKFYSPFAMVVPLGFGFKYNITDQLNFFGEMNYRFTTTDYLDDVSGTYAGANAFPNGSVVQKLQDRSYVYGKPIGEKGRQRGNTSQKDSYATLQVGISVNIQKYRCPTY